MSEEASGKAAAGVGEDPTEIDFTDPNFARGEVGRDKCGSLEGETDRTTGVGSGDRNFGGAGSFCATLAAAQR